MKAYIVFCCESPLKNSGTKASYIQIHLWKEPKAEEPAYSHRSADLWAMEGSGVDHSGHKEQAHNPGSWWCSGELCLKAAQRIKKKVLGTKGNARSILRRG